MASPRDGGRVPFGGSVGVSWGVEVDSRAKRRLSFPRVRSLSTGSESLTVPYRYVAWALQRRERGGIDRFWVSVRAREWHE
jgi:hypothetical protein